MEKIDFFDDLGYFRSPEPQNEHHGDRLSMKYVSTGTQGQILSEFGSKSAGKWILTKTHQDSVFSGFSAQEG